MIAIRADRPQPPTGPPSGRHHSLAAKLATTLLLCVAAANATSASVRISGIDGDEERAALAEVKIPECIQRRWQLRELNRQLTRAIEQQRRARGDYRPRIRVQRSLDAPCFSLTVEVEPGAPVKIRRRDLELRGDAEARARLQPLLDSKPLRVGAAFVESNWEAMKSTLGARALELGYFDARIVTSRVDVYLDADSVDLTLEFVTGPRYTVGEVRVEVEGRPLDRTFIDRFITLVPGQPWRSTDLAATRRALLGSSYFADARITPDLDAAQDTHMPVLIELTTVARYEVTAGVGFATDVGPRVNAEFVDNLANRRGHRYEISGSGGPRRSEARAGYRLPARDIRSWWSVDGGAGRQVTRSSRNEELRIGLRYVTQLNPRWRRTLLLDSSFTRFDVGPDNQLARLVVPGVIWDFERLDANRRLPQGLTLRAEMTAASNTLLSQTSFLRLSTRARFTRRLTDKLRAATRIDIGATAARDFRKLPPDHRFFAGGDSSVRGFDRDQLGPVDAGEVIGGRYLIAGSVELERLVRGDWGVAVFTDAGQAFSALPFDLEFASGVGVRWFSPVGSIRIDVAAPLKGGPPRLHIGLGRTL